MAVSFDTGIFSVIGLSSELLVGAKLYWYATGTSTPLATYSDNALSVPNANPVVAGADGRFGPIFLQSAAYKYVLKTALGVTLVTRDPIDGVSGATVVLAELAAPSGATLVNFSHSNRGAHGEISWKLTETASVTDPPFSATADGTANDFTAITAAIASGRQVVFPAGTYKIGTSITLTNVMLLNGAKLKPAAGVVITIGGTLNAPLAQIFDTSLGGTIVIDPSSDTWGHPEWWGAVTNTGVDCYAALMACHTASRQTRLQFADYYIAQTAIFDLPFKRIRGKERDYNGAPGQATRLIMMDGVSNIVQIGPTTLPGGGFNSFPQGIDFGGVWVTRSVAPTIAGGCIGVTVQYVLRAYLEDIAADENITGFLVRGTVDTELHACRSFRSLAGTGAGTDKSWGFDIDGSINIGAAGGNASVRLTNCRSAYGGTPPTNSIGCNIHGAITDTFVKEFEDVTDKIGIQVTGLGATDTSLVANMDVLFQHPVCDQNATAPIHIQDINPFGSIEIVSPYAGPATGASAGILLQNCGGTVSIRGGQVPMIGASGSPGISADACSRLYIDGTIIMESSAATGAVVLNNCSGYVAPVVTNFLYGTPASVLVTGSSSAALRVAPVVGGSTATPHVTHGIQVISGAANNSEYVVSGINKATLAGAKLTIAGVDQATPGVVPSGGTSIMTGPVT